ncbi:hypothetical protein O7627_08545 [Solwaraspora sp. WMMD1047]|uniref:hypothetical protein n=1 Tax=Solwaraspora sp. WMMD1047 TaxID=3016102 RepID=UPI0024161B43|nr:hypothetical protein [Solwaraspora sp. WMMD1047]MDG4829353.1 hypothetical protein [Solwaraspora sp. WMMD1047]
MEVVPAGREVAIDLTGQSEPDGTVPGRYRRRAMESVVPELRVTARCDGALVYERSEERPAPITTNQRAGRYTPPVPRQRIEERS